MSNCKYFEVNDPFTQMQDVFDYKDAWCGAHAAALLMSEIATLVSYFYSHV